MKKTVLTFGLIAGAILSAMMLITIPFQDEIGIDHSLIIGYTTMVIAFLLIYFGVRSYRDNVAGGTVRFGRAFAVGASIGLVASLCYVAMWQVVYFNFMPDFLDEYNAHAVEKLKASGASDTAVQAQIKEMERFNELYQNPLFNAAVTLIEPLPVGLVITLLSAAILKKKPQLQPTQSPTPAS